ncbi:MAG: ATP-binding protein, partial [Myxococcota bacterium]
LEVQDEGAGMTESVRQRAPEAFFTTKKKGTGLGLATAHDIVASYGGTLRIDSHVGQGTTVRIELPRLVDTASAQPSLDLAR